MDSSKTKEARQDARSETHDHPGDDGESGTSTSTLPPESTPPYSTFTTWQKRVMVLGAAFTAFFSPVTAQIYLPAMTAIAEDLDVTNSQVNLTITTYMIFQGITPMFIGSLADSGGRRPAYLICFVIYIAANIGLALAPHYGALLGLRCLQSAGSSSTVALCTAVVADLVTSAERGQYIGFTVVPAVLAPALGPVVGGLLSEFLGWRSIFWFLAILAGVATVLVVVFFPETCRHIVGDGSLYPPAMYRSVWQILRSRRRTVRAGRGDHGASGTLQPKNPFKFNPPNVLASLLMLFERETGLLLWSSSLVFAGFYCVASAMPILFSSRYGFDETKVGLMYLPLAAGSVGAASLVGPLINWNFRRHCAKLGIPWDRSRQQELSEFPVERARLEIGLPLLAVGGASLIGWGWAVNATAHVAVPCVISVIFGVGMIGYNNTTNVLLVDMYPGKAGTATAANNLTRCLVGAGASAAIVPMMDAMGVGWSFTLVGGLYLLCFAPLLAIMSHGMQWRAELKIRMELDKAGKDQKRAAHGLS